MPESPKPCSLAPTMECGWSNRTCPLSESNSPRTSQDCDATVYQICTGNRETIDRDYGLLVQEKSMAQSVEEPRIKITPMIGHTQDGQTQPDPHFKIES